MCANPSKSAGYSFPARAEAAFRELVSRPEFPCLGAKAAFNSDSHTIRVFDELGSLETTDELAAALYDFTSSRAERSEVEGSRGTASGNSTGSLDFARDDIITDRPPEYATFIAIFERPCNLSEREFEELLWKQLRLLHERDAVHFDWDPQVASDPDDPHFSFSFGGRALYVIGMHAHSSREARKFPWPVLVFNPHEQFERLRDDGKWKRMQQSIRQRDVELQGSINPMLSDFGEQSEARQYSGRVVEEDWRAPFEPTQPKCPFAH